MKNLLTILLVLLGSTAFAQDGTLDTTFDAGTGSLYPPSSTNAVECAELQADGKVIVGGYFSSFNGKAVRHVARLNDDGAVDTTFYASIAGVNTVYDVAIQADGYVIVGGTFSSIEGRSRNGIARLKIDGSLDTLFNPGSGFNGPVRSMAIQSDGKIIVGGAFTSFNGIPVGNIARLNANGSLDAPFVTGTGFGSYIRTITLQADGKIICGGIFTSYNGTAAPKIARLNTDGSFDSSFDVGTGFQSGTGSQITATALQSDGKIIVIGGFSIFNGVNAGSIVRLNTDGSVDASFNVGGIGSAGSNLQIAAIQADDKIIIGGMLSSYNGTPVSRIARLYADGSLDATFDQGTGFNSQTFALCVQPDGKIIAAGSFSSYNGVSKNAVVRLNVENSFVTRWDLSIGGAATDLSFFATTSGTVSYFWEELSPGNATGSGTFSGDATISGLPSGSIIRLSIAPANLNSFSLNNLASHRNRLVDVEQWGDMQWTSAQSAFYGCANLQISATDVPDLSAVTDMSQMFRGCTILNGPANISTWNTASVTTMRGLFYSAAAFNQPIGSWNMASVTDLYEMFRSATAFNQAIGTWNTVSAETMTRMFWGATSFNQPIGTWTTTNVTDMGNMFRAATSFNQNIGGWNTASVTGMASMLNGAAAFNQNIGSWNTASVISMASMFNAAASFNQNIGSWTLNSAVNMSAMLDNCGMDCESYSNTLNGWRTNNPSLTYRVLGASGLQYGTNALSTHLALVFSLGWSISGDASIYSDCRRFITRWDLSIGGDVSEIAFAVETSGTVNYSWEEVSPGMASGAGSSTGTTATISGLPAGAIISLRIEPANFNRININNGTHKNRLVDVEQWGGVAWTSMENAFYGCSNLQISSTDVPNLSGVTNMDYMFTRCTILNGPSNINSWNTSTVNSMERTFYFASAFNQNIGNWNTAAVTSMLWMFTRAEAFNQDIGGWNTGLVTNMQYMFRYAISFNQNISGWNTANVSDVLAMFENATAFNQPIGSWDIGNMVSMTSMFRNATAFNQDLSGWNTAGVISFGTMFEGASSFNQNLGSWILNPSVSASMGDMLTDCGMDCENYSKTLIGWLANNPTVTGRYLSSTNLEYGTNAVAARHALTTTQGWTITGDVASGVSCDPDLFVTKWDLSIGGDVSEIAFDVETSGTVNYSWHELSPGSASGIGSFSGTTATISGLPSGAIIRVHIEAANFNRININNGTHKNRLVDVEQWGGVAWTSMENAFNGCSNLDITATDVPDLSALTQMSSMFEQCTALNAPSNIATWNTADVTHMNSMFNGASSFNQDISGWNTADVIFLNGMFFNASSFNQNLGSWILTTDVSMADMLSNCGMNCENYSTTLIGWQANNPTVTGRSLGAALLTYNSDGEVARDALVSSQGWEFEDGGLGYTTGTDVQTACGSYTWMDGNEYTASNNTATYSIVGGSSTGCDSIITLNLTISLGTTWYADTDSDGFGDALSTQVACTQPSGYVANDTDCDDTNWLLWSSCYQWTGAVSTDWNDGGNWSGGNVPTAADDITITSIPSSQPHVTSTAASPAACANLIINGLALLTVDAGKALTVNGNMVLTGDILVKADETGIGSLITYGNKAGNGFCKMEQYLTGSNNAGTPNGVFYYVTPPVTSAQASVYDLASGNKLWAANESSQSYPQITDGFNVLDAGRGYVVRMGDISTITYSANAFNTGDVEIGALTRTGTTATNRGYNLVGNPYPSSVNWSNVDTTNLYGSIWYRTHTSNDVMTYDTYNAVADLGTSNNFNGTNATGIIPPAQAFWVRVKNDNSTASVNFTNAMRSHGTLSGIYKQAAEDGTVRMTLSDGTTSDETILLFNENASDDFDAYDSHKFWATASLSQIYMNEAVDTLAINGLYSTQTNPIVELGVKLPSAGSYTLNATSITLNEDVYLEDRMLGIFQDLNLEPSYAFSSSVGGNIPTRFALHFGMAITGIEDGVEANSHVYTSSGSQLNVILSENIENGNVQVLDMAGRIILTANLTSSRTTLDMNASTGVYLVRVETEKGTYTHRVILN
ncbi:MAG: BspA family leucine-rich repeat surface protein [Flavobacteriales bacterium]|nr:BspA family leucine-rich repeat surface protein [Flavobacteriales bacterium]